LVVAGLALLVLVGAVFAVIAPPAFREPETTSINVVCLFDDSPAASYIHLFDAKGNEISRAETASGFAFFKVVKNKSYSLTAYKIEESSEISSMVPQPSASQKIYNISSPAIIKLVLKSREAASLREIARPGETRIPPAAKWTSINVVAIYKDFPTIARIGISKIDTAGTRLILTEYTPTGFASFRVEKNKSYRVDADKIDADAYIEDADRSGQMLMDVVIAANELTMNSPSKDILNISSAAVVGIIITPIEESGSSTPTTLPFRRPSGTIMHR
jgi:hypothetical protein